MYCGEKESGTGQRSLRDYPATFLVVLVVRFCMTLVMIHEMGLSSRHDWQSGPFGAFYFA